MESKARVKEWGNSLGIIIPREVAKKENLKPDDEVIIEIIKKRKIKDIFGSLKEWKIDSQKMKDELRKDWNK
ncbi:AbrB/MazE/SpoVT family DNA-binding domain-containing protein [Candidatus Woesearchaeota archaeon]|nr:AbrB/MazE/SpoVT family DNA-binding domain-containing protein [Candidatus Woesearchaeota archaeon]